MVRSYCDKPTDPAQNVSKAATSERCTKLSLNMLSLLFFIRLQFKHEAKGSFDEGASFLDELTYLHTQNTHYQPFYHKSNNLKCQAVVLS